MQFTPRKLLFKAWNQETKLLMRLNRIDCVKGELFSKDHVLLQFTGHHDQKQEEIYEMDVLLIGGEKWVVFWSQDENAWSLSPLAAPDQSQPFSKSLSKSAIRICNYFESQQEE